MIVDNFYENPDSITNKMFSGGFGHAYPPLDDHVGYTKKYRDQWYISRIALRDEWILEKFEKLIDSKIDKNFWHNGVQWNGRFLSKFNDADVSFHNHDNKSRGLEDGNDVGADGWSAIVFMNPKNPIDQGFTTVHIDDKDIPMDSIFLQDFDYSSGDVYANYQLDDDATRQAQTQSSFQYDSYIGNIYNRCVLFRGNIFHSGAGGIGDTIEDSRIIHGFFFKEAE